MNYKVGDIVDAVVTGIENYGIFMKLEDQTTGLIHISEINDNFIKDITSYVNVGEKIKVKIIELDQERNQYKLTIKNVNYRSEEIDNSNGFEPLAKKLDFWVEQKLEEYNEK